MDGVVSPSSSGKRGAKHSKRTVVAGDTCLVLFAPLSPHGNLPDMRLSGPLSQQLIN